MSKTFRDWEPDRVWLLPPALQDLVPAGHVAHFVRDTVCHALDLSAILASYGEARGYPPYHPGMMVALLLYGYRCIPRAGSRGAAKSGWTLPR
jgi:transposase